MDLADDPATPTALAIALVIVAAENRRLLSCALCSCAGFDGAMLLAMVDGGLGDFRNPGRGPRQRHSLAGRGKR